MPKKLNKIWCNSHKTFCPSVYGCSDCALNRIKYETFARKEKTNMWIIIMQSLTQTLRGAQQSFWSNIMASREALCVWNSVKGHHHLLHSSTFLTHFLLIKMKTDARVFHTCCGQYYMFRIAKHIPVPSVSSSTVKTSGALSIRSIVLYMFLQHYNHINLISKYRTTMLQTNTKSRLNQP